MAGQPCQHLVLQVDFQEFKEPRSPHTRRMRAAEGSKVSGCDPCWRLSALILAIARQRRRKGGLATQRSGARRGGRVWLHHATRAQYLTSAET
ncbi:hypothetical protein K402DRAFT_152565 [Aulographum hederae CBS 113979]|uniref:Uncharacterized protein n=1 Tax=Aulographum hederae CBS 113979 TaxID=1176131 RepID=A0A6G1GT36_9PEZI|nr:hypothetical protein K402DRAFT_152565 [Aulographum hederae CBS 113979]